MALNFRSDGYLVDYVNLGRATYWGAADIPSGSIVVDNLLYGVAMSEIVYSGNESGSLDGQMLSASGAGGTDFMSYSNNVCRIGEWGYDALLAANMQTFAKLYWNKNYNVLVQDASTAAFQSDVTAGAPDYTNQGTYGSTILTGTPTTTEWFQLSKNMGDALYTLWGSFTGTISAVLTATNLTNGYTHLGNVITFGSITTAVAGDRWEWYAIKAEANTVNLDIGIVALPYSENVIKHLGQAYYNMPLVQPKTSANVVKAGAYITAKWDTRFRQVTPSQGGGKIQLGKLIFQFIQ
jgi:hypothetical protein